MAGPQKSVVAALLVVVLLLFLVRRLSTPARTIVFLRTKLQALPSSDPVEHSRTVRSRPLSSLPLQSALPPLPPQLRRRPPPPPPPPPPCTKLECTTKLQSLEPDWVQLSSQPRIDWAGGGVRGDCLVGEYDYMMMSPYCTPPGLPTPTGKKWPSPERLEAADVHSKHLPQHSVLKVVPVRLRGHPPLRKLSRVSPGRSAGAKTRALTAWTPKVGCVGALPLAQGRRFRYAGSVTLPTSQRCCPTEPSC